MTAFDIVLSLLLSLTFIAGSYIFANIFLIKKHKKVLIAGLSFKILGAIAFFLIYNFYFNRLGDTFAYLNYSNDLYHLILSKPSVIFEIFSPNSSSKSLEFYHFIRKLDFYAKWDTYTVILFSTFASFFSLGLPLATTIVFSVFSFYGLWLLFLTLDKFSNDKTYIAAIAVFFIPSLIFWGSGVLKDTLVLSFLGIFVYYFFEIQSNKKSILIYSSIIFLCLFIISLIKVYITISLLIGILVWLVSYNLEKFANPVIRIVLLPLTLVLALFIVSIMLIQVENYFPQFSTKRVLLTAASYQKHHYSGGDVTKSGSGSGYTLGDYDPTVTGVLLKVFPAINVTLFRPYIWEVRNPMMLLSALESLVLLILFLNIMIKVGPINFWVRIKKNPFLVFCLSFSLFFAFAIGFSSYNFGALARYKTPLFPFFVFMLLFVFNEVKNEKKKAFFLKG